MQKKEEKKIGIYEFLKCIGLGTGIAILMTLLITVLWTVLIASERVSWDMANQLTIATVFFAPLIGGIIAGKKYGARALAVGASVGTIITIIIIITTAVYPPAGEGSGMLFTKVISSIAGGSAGGILSVIKIKKRHT